jgi:Xaa-Pro dipeptidase
MYATRREQLYQWMEEEGIAVVMFEDTESRRDPAVRWISGHPGDALVFLSVDRQCLLVPWDMNLAALFGDVDAMIPYTEFERQPIKALKGAAEFFKIPFGSKLEITPVTPYTLFLQYVETLTEFDIICRNEGAHEKTETLRTIKDPEEIEIYRKVSAITNAIIDLLEQNISSGKLQTEGDVALFIEAESRRQGCEGTGFATLAAGPQRSCWLHSFPA